MGKSAVGTDDALTKKAWEVKLFRDSVKKAYFKRFMGESKKALVWVKNKLTKEKGDQITFGLRRRLDGAGITGSGTLEGNEEALQTDDYAITLEQYRHAVRDAGELDRQRPIYDMDTESKEALQDWGAEKIDQLCFDAIAASPTKIFYGDGTSTSTITAAGKITPTLISKWKTWAKTGGNRSYIPLKPITINGKRYYVLLVHPDAMFDLKTDSIFTQAMREAEVRGKENPLFQNATAIWDGVVIHEHENVPIVTNWGSGSDVPGAKCSFMGAGSLVWAWGKRKQVVARDFDYGNEHGFAWKMIAKCGKPVFDSKDYGSLGIYVARTQISDA